jgi:hypothetical protein
MDEARLKVGIVIANGTELCTVVQGLATIIQTEREREREEREEREREKNERARR